MSEETAGERLRFAWFVTVAYVVLTVPRLLLHELWRDEAWLWLVVTESRSLADLFVPLSRSGEGYLFPLLCFLARQVSTSPRAMQFVHLILAGAGAFSFARWAPFGRWERALFLLGYFPFYEYAVISRHYAAGALLVWLGCVAARSSHQALALGSVLGLLCQTTVYGYILAIAIASGWMLDRWLRRSEIAPLQRREAMAGFCLAFAGAVAGLVQLIPAPGTSFASGWIFAWDPARTARMLRTPWRAFVPLPLPQLHFWNSNLLDDWPGPQMAAGVLTLVLTVALLWRHKAALATFGLGATGLLTFGYIKLVGLLRHQGHLWLLFIAALWLAGGQALQNGRRSWRSWVFLLLLILQLGAGVYATWMDLRYPFSNGAAIAKLIRRQGLDRFPLLGYREPPAATVALALGRPLYSPSRGVFATYPDWGPEQRDLSLPEVRCAARKLAREESGDVVLVVNRELPPWPEIRPAGARRRAIVGSEAYSLYRLRFRLLQATAGAAGCADEPAQDTGSILRHNKDSRGGSSGSSTGHLRHASFRHLSRGERAAASRPEHRP